VLFRSLFFGMYQSFLQAWFMGFLFLLAGYFVPISFDRKGAGKFVADRAYRLGTPSLIYVVFVQPFIVWILLPAYRSPTPPCSWAIGCGILRAYDSLAGRDRCGSRLRC